MACTVCGKVYIWNPDENVDAKPHVCKTCGFSFSLKIQLKRHTLIHANNEPYVCITCTSNPSKEESNSYNLRLNKSYPCEVCGECFSSKRILLRHSIRQHRFQDSDEESERNESESEDSDYEVDSDEPVKKRSRKKSRGPSKKKKSAPEHHQFKCPNCSKAFVYPASYDKHVKLGKCLDETPVKPSTGTKKVKKRVEKKSASKKEKHECEVCGKNFTRKSSLEGHMKEHEREDLQYNDYSSDNTAVNSDDSEEPEPEKPIKTTIKKSFTCQRCNFVCFSQITLNRHTNRVHKPKVVTEFLVEEEASRAEESSSAEEKTKETFLCEICDKVFSTKGRLKKHLLFHMTNELEPSGQLFPTRKRREKRYRCEECGKQFAGVACLNKHILRHSGRTPEHRPAKGPFKTMECDFCHEVICGKRSTFMKHVNSHTPEVCGICDERFVDRASLREHCKVHLGTEEGKMFMECSQKALEAKLGILPPEPKVEYIYLVLR